jgi:hypothetical protein
VMVGILQERLEDRISVKRRGTDEFERLMELSSVRIADSSGGGA